MLTQDIYAQDNLAKKNCTRFIARDRQHENAEMLGEGEEYISGHTGCHVPCDQNVYKVNVAYTTSMKDYPTFFNMSKEAFNQGTYLVIKKFKNEEEHLVNVLEEVYAYSANTFVSDVGGILGLFLGFSIFGSILTLFEKVMVGYRNNAVV